MSKLPSYEEINLPIRVGIVGTGFAAKVRAQSLATESRTQLVAVAGRNPERTAEFAQSFDVLAVADWQTLVQMPHRSGNCSDDQCSPQCDRPCRNRGR